MLVQVSKTNYSKREEVLRKSNLSDLESRTTMTSEAIGKHKMDASYSACI